MTTLHQLRDKDLTCAACGDGFIFTAGEQELYRLRGVTDEPERCPSCSRSHARPVAGSHKSP